MSTGCQGGYYAVTFTTERKLSIVSSTGYLSALIVGSFVGYLVGAWLADRTGRRNPFLIFSLGAIAVVLLYTQLQLTNELLLFWSARCPLRHRSPTRIAIFAVAAYGVFSSQPTRYRKRGGGFCVRTPKRPFRRASPDF
jgi:MFS family permease